MSASERASPGVGRAEGAPRLLNVGCGRRAHPAWTNVDVAPLAPGVAACDIRRGLPFPAERFDAVYQSHVLEHLTVEEGAALLRECRRVLRPGGVIRVVVPDLENIASSYLAALEAAREGAEGGAERHAWMVLELVDQASRRRSGGAIPEFLRSASEAGRRFAVERWGAEARDLLSPAPPPPRRSPLEAPRRWARRLAAAASERWRVGDFRLGGEIHEVMYDSFSLSRALGAAGFEHVETVGACESRIAGWTEYRLDADAAGVPHKPDSLYMEAVKAGRGGD